MQCQLWLRLGSKSDICANIPDSKCANPYQNEDVMTKVRIGLLDPYKQHHQRAFQQKGTLCAFDHSAYSGAGFLPTLAF